MKVQRRLLQRESKEHSETKTEVDTFGKEWLPRESP
jgi:hypothetical protein